MSIHVLQPPGKRATRGRIKKALNAKSEGTHVGEMLRGGIPWIAK